jgi:predicted 3-demethylubiquinone-9 3-methyltransferase (glyoxalase superfamily)
MGNQKVSPFLTFTGKAEEAMRFYASALPGAEITRLERYGKGRPGSQECDENSVLYGVLSFMGREVCFLDMEAAHPAPEFTWAASLLVSCRDEAEFNTVFDGLSRGGHVMMGPVSTEFFRKCAWVTDKFGVTWQPVLE